jgi:hypothetical protein
MIWGCIGSPQLIRSFEGVRLQSLLKKPEKQIRSQAEETVSQPLLEPRLFCSLVCTPEQACSTHYRIQQL